MRNQRLERALRLLRLLQQGRRPIDTLARDLDVSTRTIRRDLESLSLAGFPIQNVTGDYGDTHLYSVGHDGRCPVCNRL